MASGLSDDEDTVMYFAGEPMPVPMTDDNDESQDDDDDDQDEEDGKEAKRSRTRSRSPWPPEHKKPEELQPPYVIDRQIEHLNRRCQSLRESFVSEFRSLLMRAHAFDSFDQFDKYCTDQKIRPGDPTDLETDIQKVIAEMRVRRKEALNSLQPISLDLKIRNRLFTERLCARQQSPSTFEKYLELLLRTGNLIDKDIRPLHRTDFACSYVKRGQAPTETNGCLHVVQAAKYNQAQKIAIRKHYTECLHLEMRPYNPNPARSRSKKRKTDSKDSSSFSSSSSSSSSSNSSSSSSSNNSSTSSNTNSTSSAAKEEPKLCDWYCEVGLTTDTKILMSLRNRANRAFYMTEYRTNMNASDFDMFISEQYDQPAQSNTNQDPVHPFSDWCKHITPRKPIAAALQVRYALEDHIYKCIPYQKPIAELKEIADVFHRNFPTVLANRVMSFMTVYPELYYRKPMSREKPIAQAAIESDDLLSKLAEKLSKKRKLELDCELVDDDL